MEEKFSRRVIPAGTTLFFVLAVLSIGLAHIVDMWVVVHVSVPGIYETDWGRMFRIVGYLPLWLAMALVVFLTDRVEGQSFKRVSLRRGILLLLAPSLAGIAGELLKIVIRRERPNPELLQYVFKPFSDGLLKTGGLGVPSSHAVVAFGAASILSRLFPQAAPVWWLLAVGCGISRILATAHYTSDVVAAAFLGYGVAWLCWKWIGGNLVPTKLIGASK